MERINTSMDNQGSNNNYNNGNSNGGNNGDGGKGNHNGQILMAFILISLIALFIMSLVTNQFNQMSTQEVVYQSFKHVSLLKEISTKWKIVEVEAVRARDV